jgi:CAAX protease family protein
MVWAPLVLGQDGLKLLHVTPSVPVLICIGTLGPALACYLTHHRWAGNWQAVRFFPWHGLDWLWLLIGPSLVLLGYFVILPLLASNGPPNAWYRHVRVLSGIPGVMFSYNLLGGPLFEEFGWRGFLQARLQQTLAPWMAAGCVGVLWAAWHLPLFLVDGWNSGPVLAFFGTCVGLSVVFAFCFNASGQSIVVAILMHAAFNASPRFIGPYLENCPMRGWLTGESFIAAAFLVLAAALVAITKGNLAAVRTAVERRASTPAG